MADDAGLANMFPVQRYRPNRSGKIALSIYCVAFAIAWLYLAISNYTKPEKSWEGLLKIFIFPPIPLFYYFGYIVSDPMEFRDGMCKLGYVLTNLFMFADSVWRGYTTFNSSDYIPMVIFLLSIPIQVSVFVPENWPGAKTFRPHLLRPEEEVEAERNELVRKYRGPV